MLNLAGREYDFGPVLFAVLQECEHRRRSLPADEAEAAPKRAEIVRQKLAEIELCYLEAGGTPGYWRELQNEVIDTAMPQYARSAAAQSSLELASYGLWRQGDPLSRGILGLAGLAAGGLIVRAPFIPIFEDAFAFVLAAVAFFYPEIRRGFFDWRYSRLLNRLVVQAETYQHRQLPYVSEAGLAAELAAVGAAAPVHGAVSEPAAAGLPNAVPQAAAAESSTAASRPAAAERSAAAESSAAASRPGGPEREAAASQPAGRRS
jgi:hypothetical protein